MTGRREWSDADVDVLARAAVAAPSVHDTQPWRLELPERQALLFARTDVTSPHHDPDGLDADVSCGAAIANLELAMSVLGVRPHTVLLPDPDRPELVARVAAAEKVLPTDLQLLRYTAIARRPSHRHVFARGPVTAADLDDLVPAPSDDRVRVHVLRGHRELLALADVLACAAVTPQFDHRRQRELELWALHVERSRRHGAGGPLPMSMLPWAGLVRPGAALPDSETLARRLAAETVLLISSATDSRPDTLRTGIELQRCWLTAVAKELAAAELTQPLHLAGARERLREALGIDGLPRVLLRVGVAPGVLPRSPHRHVGELLLLHG